MGLIGRGVRQNKNNGQLGFLFTLKSLLLILESKKKITVFSLIFSKIEIIFKH